MNNNRPRIVTKAEAVARLAMLNAFPPSSISCLVNEFPKSGGTWLARMLADATQNPFPEHQFPKKFPAIFHGHYLALFKNKKKIILWRDPRDIAVSLYHHKLFPNQYNNHARVKALRLRLGYKDLDNVNANMPNFIKFMFTEIDSPKYTWNQFFDTWFDIDDVNTMHTSYEFLLRDTAGELKKLLSFLEFDVKQNEIESVVGRFSFAALTNRVPGVEETGNFLRKGIAGDWKNVFNDEASSVMERFVDFRLKRFEERFLVD